MTKLEDVYTVTHRGVTITVQKRRNGQVDYGYKTSNNITGIGQQSARQAEIDAMHAIDLAMYER